MTSIRPNFSGRERNVESNAVVEATKRCPANQKSTLCSVTIKHYFKFRCSVLNERRILCAKLCVTGNIAVVAQTGIESFDYRPLPEHGSGSAPSCY
jgi:hypothetical protein